MRTPQVLLLLLAFLLAAPAAASGWGGGPGSKEPNTPQDRDGGYMFLTPPGPGREAIYFDGFPSVDGTVLNPNVATAGTRLLAPGPTSFNAFLGLWADCNGDGYIGSAEGALQDYPASLVTDHVACPVGGPHNDGQWATELITLGMVDPCEFASTSYQAQHCPGVHPVYNDPVVRYEPIVRVWGDSAAPGAPPALDCPRAPLPRGSTASAGGLLRWIDCQDGYATRDAVDQHAPQAGPVLGTPFPVTPFGDPTTGRAGLLQQGSGDPAFTTWDCTRPTAEGVYDPNGAVGKVALQDPTPGSQLSGQEPIPVVGATTIFDNGGQQDQPGTFRPLPDNSQGQTLWAPAPNPRLNDPKGSYWDAASMAFDGPRGDCNPATSNTLDALYVGSSVEGNGAFGSPAMRTSNDLVFTFAEGYRGLNPAVDPTLNSGHFPSDFGAVYTRNIYGGPMWTATQQPFARPALVRDDTLSPEPPSWFTFYASFTDPYIQLPGAIGTYGQEACTTGIGGGAPGSNGWACDPGLWWRNLGGADNMPRYTDGTPLGAFPGDSFTMRDVDCYDNAPAPSLNGCPG